jgi:hypothetical protein
MSPAMKWLRTSKNRNDLALAILRIAVGGMFLIFSEYKVFGTQFTLHGGFEWWINRFLKDGAAYPIFVPVSLASRNVRFSEQVKCRVLVK